MVCWTFSAEKLAPPDSKYRHKRNGKLQLWRISPRYRVVYIFALLYLALTILLEVRLSRWSLTSEDLGHCYRTHGITSMTASHPSADKIYVAITASWMLLVMFGTIYDNTKRRKVLLILSSLQFPLQ